MSWTKEIHGGNSLPILIEAHVKGLALLAPCVAVVELIVTKQFNRK